MSQPGLSIKPDGIWRLGRCEDCPPPTPESPVWAWHFMLPEHQGLSHLGLTPRLHICPPTPDPMGKGPLLGQLWRPSQLGPGLPLLPPMPHPTSNPTSMTSARAWRPSSSSLLAFLRVLKGLKSPSPSSEHCPLDPTSHPCLLIHILL